jgi:hypothetical protein
MWWETKLHYAYFSGEVVISPKAFHEGTMSIQQKKQR